MATLFADGLLAPPPTLLAADSGALMSLPPPTLLSGSTCVVLSIPPVTLLSNDGLSPYQAIALTVPPPTMSAGVVTGSYNSADLLVPAPELDASGIDAAVLSALLTAPLPLLSASVVVGNILSISNAAPAPLLLASGVSGNVLSAALAAPVVILLASSYPINVLTAVNSVPLLQLDSFLSAPIFLDYRTWVVNLRKGAIAEYNNFSFNSYATFRGQLLACGPAGVVVLGTQSQDDVTPITARVRTGKSDYGHTWLKRVPRLYLKYKTDGDLIFRTITSESGQRSYSLGSNGVVGFQQRRVPIGRGPKAAFWQYEWENVAGADFSVQSVLAYPINLRRRIM